IVARGLTRVQATALYDNLSKQPEAQKVEVLDELERGGDVAGPGTGQAWQQPLVLQQANAGLALQYGRQGGEGPATHPADEARRGYGEYASKDGGTDQNWKMETPGSAGGIAA